MKKFFILATLLVATISFMSCKKDKETPAVTYGTEVKLGNGTAKSFVKLDAAGNPEELGVAISEDAMNSLPHNGVGTDLVLNLPSEGAKTPYKFVLLNYMHGGHEPNGIYTKDHFDVHFYTVPNTVRESITSPQDPRLFKFPAAGDLPSTYIFAGPVPMMGAHWADSTAAEFRGQPFLSTFIYGSLDGGVIFNEPMVTIELMKQKEHNHYSIKQPTKYPTTGYFPNEYCVRFNEADKQHEVVLENMTMR
jgi:Domain of unknown function (DUF5602)